MGTPTQVVRDQFEIRTVQPGDLVLQAETIPVVNVVGSTTLTAAQMCTGILYRSGSTAAFTDTTDTAANIINQLITNYNYNTSSVTGVGGGLGAMQGQTFRMRYINSVAYAATIAAGTGVTLGYNATTVNASSVKDFLVTVTNGSAPQTFAATTTNTSAVITGLNQFQTGQLSPGMAVSGTGIPASTNIISVQQGVGVTLNNNATASGTLVALSFSPTIRLDGLGQGLL